MTGKALSGDVCLNRFNEFIMSYSEYLQKIFYLVDLLNQGNAGPADILAKKLNVSRRTLFRYMDELRLKGAVIDFSKREKTYFLKNEFDFSQIFL